MSLTQAKNVARTHQGNNHTQALYHALDQKDQILTDDQVTTLINAIKQDQHTDLSEAQLAQIIHTVATYILANQISNPKFYSDGMHSAFRDTKPLTNHGRSIIFFEQILDLSLFLASSYYTYLGARQLAGRATQAISDTMEWNNSPLFTIVVTELAATAAGVSLAELVKRIKDRTKREILDRPTSSTGPITEIIELTKAYITNGLNWLKGTSRTIALASGIIFTGAAAVDVGLNVAGVVNAVAHTGDKKEQVNEVIRSIEKSTNDLKDALKDLNQSVSSTLETAIKTKLQAEEQGKGSTGSPGKGPAYHAIKVLNTGSAESRKFLVDHSRQIAQQFSAQLNNTPGFQVEFEQLMQSKTRSIEVILTELDNHVSSQITSDSPIENLQQALKAVTGNQGYLKKISDEYQSLINDIDTLIKKYNKLEQALADIMIQSNAYPNAQTGKTVQIAMPELPTDGSNINLQTEFEYKSPQALAESLKKTKTPSQISIILLLSILAGIASSYANMLLYPLLKRYRRKDLTDVEEINQTIEKFVKELTNIIFEFLNNGTFAEFYTSPTVPVTHQHISKAIYQTIDQRAATTQKRGTNNETKTANARLQALQSCLQFNSCRGFISDFFQQLFNGNVKDQDYISGNDDKMTKEASQFPETTQNLTIAIQTFRRLMEAANSREEAQRIIDQTFFQIDNTPRLNTKEKTIFKQQAEQIITEANQRLTDQYQQDSEQAQKDRTEENTKQQRFIAQIHDTPEQKQAFHEFIKNINKRDSDPETVLQVYYKANQNTVVGQDFRKFCEYLAKGLEHLVNVTYSQTDQDKKIKAIAQTKQKIEQIVKKLTIAPTSIDLPTLPPDTTISFQNIYTPIAERPDTITPPTTPTQKVTRAIGRVTRLIAMTALTFTLGQNTLGNKSPFGQTGDNPTSATPLRSPEISNAPVTLKAPTTKEFKVQFNGNETPTVYEDLTPIAGYNITISENQIIINSNGQYTIDMTTLNRNSTNLQEAQGSLIKTEN